MNPLASHGAVLPAPLRPNTTKHVHVEDKTKPMNKMFNENPIMFRKPHLFLGFNNRCRSGSCCFAAFGPLLLLQKVKARGKGKLE